MTLEDLAYRWDSPADCRKQSPDELGFKEGSTGPQAKFAAMHMMQAVLQGQADA